MTKVLDPEIANIASRYADELGVSKIIHPQDYIFDFIVNKAGFDTAENAVRYYFHDGRKSCETLRDCLLEVGRSPVDCRILEFASGYGCVTRHFGQVLPSSYVTSVDIHSAAVSFIENSLGHDAFVSNTRPDRLAVPGSYDVVFALSFLSHMPKATWANWLQRLYDFVKTKGLLIFTTHGDISSRKHMGNPELDEDGFWFCPSSEQGDLDGEDYGLTATSPAFVRSMIEKLPDHQTLQYRLGFWWEHQDLWIVRREQDA